MPGNFWNTLKSDIKAITNISDHIDTDAAARSIRSNVAFRGPNVWILAFSIIIASVGLNVNSTAVIIGAMLISPLMGPIIGIGLGLGVNDTKLIRGGSEEPSGDGGYQPHGVISVFSADSAQAGQPYRVAVKNQSDHL